MKKSFFLLFCALLAVVGANAEEYISISGRVVDARNHNMAQVNVRAVGSSIATVTNGDGEFFLKLPMSSSNDAVKFSSVGYNNEVLSVKQLLSTKDDLVVELMEESVALEGISVGLRNATSYMEEVLNRRFENNAKERSLQTAFYREMIKKRQSYATLAEAVIEIDKQGFQSYHNDRALIYKGRSLRDKRFTDTLFVKFQGGVVSSLLLDVAKNAELLFTENPKEEYYFWFDRPTTIDGRRMQVITFNQKSDDEEMMFYRGEIYVDSLTMAIARVEFNRNIEDREDAISAFIRRKPVGVRVVPTEAKYVASYRLLDGKWLFDYCNTEINFRCHFKRQLFRNNYTITSEMVVTEQGASPKKITSSESLRSTDMLYDSAQGFYDEDFWEEYNVIEHERGIDAIVRRFQRQLKDD